MVFASILLAFVLPSVMGLTLNTPTGAADEGNLAVTWTTIATDPKFSLLLVGKTESFDVAQGIDPTTLNTTVALGEIPAGTYTLQAVNADSITTQLSTSGAFQVSATAAAAGAAAAGAGNAVAAGGAAAGTGAAATAAPATGAAATGKKGKGGAAAKAGAAGKAGKAAGKAPAAKAPAAKAPAAKAPAAKAPAGKAGKKGRGVVSAKFGRAELYRD
ncbi:hypothetical protein B0H17DRAFT_1061301 [Mycena rosella]|uniref:Uncharacterized protein n=1 Tax=Mycena rosella TaxID=1033263 RepID=A0AAD7DIR0_MYCRO|nr:hypothetical protein B0H17DRAFT_1061301 [Mycena rosella]